jgi:hypothetical protein
VLNRNLSTLKSRIQNLFEQHYNENDEAVRQNTPQPNKGAIEMDTLKPLKRPFSRNSKFQQSNTLPPLSSKVSGHQEEELKRSESKRSSNSRSKFLNSLQSKHFPQKVEKEGK